MRHLPRRVPVIVAYILPQHWPFLLHAEDAARDEEKEEDGSAAAERRDHVNLAPFNLGPIA